MCQAFGPPCRKREPLGVRTMVKTGYDSPNNFSFTRLCGESWVAAENAIIVLGLPMQKRHWRGGRRTAGWAKKRKGKEREKRIRQEKRELEMGKIFEKPATKRKSSGEYLSVHEFIETRPVLYPATGSYSWIQTKVGSAMAVVQFGCSCRDSFP